MSKLETTDSWFGSTTGKWNEKNFEGAGKQHPRHVAVELGIPAAASPIFEGADPTQSSACAGVGGPLSQPVSAATTGFNLTVSFLNTGTTTWTTAFGVRASPVPPADAPGFVAFSAPVAPGAIGTVTIPMTVPSATGTTSLSFQVASTAVAGSEFGEICMEDLVVYDDNGVCDATLDNPTVPGTTEIVVDTVDASGGAFPVSIDLLNSGSVPWTVAPVFEIRPVSATAGVTGATTVPVGTLTAPGAIENFVVSITPDPAFAGTKQVQTYRLFDVANGTFCGDTVTLTLGYSASSDAFDSACDLVSGPTDVVTSSGSFPFIAKFKNVGSAIWSDAATVEFEVTDVIPGSAAALGIGAAPVTLPHGPGTTPPSARKDFPLLNLTAPAAPGTYEIDIQLKEPIGGLFGAVCNYSVSAVAAVGLDAEYQPNSSSPVPISVVGGTFVLPDQAENPAPWGLNVSMRNNGGVVWPVGSNLLPISGDVAQILGGAPATTATTAVGGSHGFLFSMDRSTPGTYSITFRMDDGAATPFGTSFTLGWVVLPTTSVNLEATCDSLDISPPTLELGSITKIQATASFQNTGDLDWPAGSFAIFSDMSPFGFPSELLVDVGGTAAGAIISVPVGASPILNVPTTEGSFPITVLVSTSSDVADSITVSPCTENFEVAPLALDGDCIMSELTGGGAIPTTLDINDGTISIDFEMENPSSATVTWLNGQVELAAGSGNGVPFITDPPPSINLDIAPGDPTFTFTVVFSLLGLTVGTDVVIAVQLYDQTSGEYFGEICQLPAFTVVDTGAGGSPFCSTWDTWVAAQPGIMEVDEVFRTRPRFSNVGSGPCPDWEADSFVGGAPKPIGLRFGVYEETPLVGSGIDPEDAFGTSGTTVGATPVADGSSKEFALDIKAPALVGSYDFYCRMRGPGSTFFGDPSSTRETLVVPVGSAWNITNTVSSPGPETIEYVFGILGPRGNYIDIKSVTLTGVALPTASNPIEFESNNIAGLAGVTDPSVYRVRMYRVGVGGRPNPFESDRFMIDRGFKIAVNDPTIFFDQGDTSINDPIPTGPDDVPTTFAAFSAKFGADFFGGLPPAEVPTPVQLPNFLTAASMDPSVGPGVLNSDGELVIDFRDFTARTGREDLATPAADWPRTVGIQIDGGSSWIRVFGIDGYGDRWGKRIFASNGTVTEILRAFKRVISVIVETPDNAWTITGGWGLKLGMKYSYRTDRGDAPTPNISREYIFQQITTGTITPPSVAVTAQVLTSSPESEDPRGLLVLPRIDGATKYSFVHLTDSLAEQTTAKWDAETKDGTIVQIAQEEP